MLRITISTTRIPSAMHAQDRMPIQFILRESSSWTTAELKGSFSGTLPTLGSAIPLDSSELTSKEDPPDSGPEETADEEETPPAVLRVLEEPDGRDEDGGGGVLAAGGGEAGEGAGEATEGTDVSLEERSRSG